MEPSAWNIPTLTVEWTEERNNKIMPTLSLSDFEKIMTSCGMSVKHIQIHISANTFERNQYNPGTVKTFEGDDEHNLVDVTKILVQHCRNLESIEMNYQVHEEPAQDVREFITNEFHELLLVNDNLAKVKFGLLSRFVKCFEMLTRRTFFRSKRDISIIYHEDDGQESGAFIDVSLHIHTFVDSFWQ